MPLLSFLGLMDVEFSASLIHGAVKPKRVVSGILGSGWHLGLGWHLEKVGFLGVVEFEVFCLFF